MLRVKQITVPEQIEYDGKPFPYVLTPAPEASDWNIGEWIEWLKENRKAIDELLLKYGAVMFTGFPVDSPQDFHDWMEGVGLPSFPYVGGAAPRKVITERVFTANEAPPDQLIPFHHEMAQVPDYPKVLFFNCEIEPEDGGETPLAPSNAIYEQMQKMQPSFVKKLDQMGVRYVRVMPNGDDPMSPIGRGWQSTYQTGDRQEAEKQATNQGTDIQWREDGSLHTVTKVLPAVQRDVRTGKQTWFNSIIAAYHGWQDCRNDRKKAVVFADGTPMPSESMEVLDKVFQDNTAACRWRHGDVMMIDNRQVLHSRRSYKPPRRILAGLCKDRVC